MSKICESEAEVVREHRDRCWWKMVMNEGQGECVTLRRACWTLWPPGSVESSSLKAVDSPGNCVMSGWCCPTADSVLAACHMPHWVSLQQLLVKKGTLTSEWRGQRSPGASLAELFYTYLLNCPFYMWTLTADCSSPQKPNGGGGDAAPAVSRALTAWATIHTCLYSTKFWYTV
jgi:hypothetical protein